MEKYPTLHVYSLNVDQDHVHIQIEIPPNIPISIVVQKIKQASSIHLTKQFSFIRKMYIDGGIWSVGYFSSTIGLNERIIKQYIENQGKVDLPQHPNFEFS